jgi:hypothetical protein
MMSPGGLSCVVFNGSVRENKKMFLGSFFTIMFDEVC